MPLQPIPTPSPPACTRGPWPGGTPPAVGVRAHLMEEIAPASSTSPDFRRVPPISIPRMAIQTRNYNGGQFKLRIGGLAALL